ncbi:MAG: hypothetical protein V4557_09215 [Bacteroidota bacterium]
MKSSKRSFVLLFFSLFLFNALKSQETLEEYLNTHYYPFSLTNGFDVKTSVMLKQKLSPYKLVLQAEGGSHFLKLYEQLPMVWLSFLNNNFGTTRYFAEAGHSVSIVYNEYLRTGDAAYIVFPRRKPFWKNLYAFNQSIPESKRISYYGIDFESSRTYLLALRLILPNITAPAEITTSIDLIKNADPALADCDYITGLNKTLKKALDQNKKAFNDYFGNRYRDFERIVTNGASCNDIRNDRNPNMAANFLSFDREFNQQMYYGELGAAHTILTRRVTAASIINNSEQFKDKVCVVNLFCDNCSTAEEGKATNWTLRDVEKDIAAYFLPLCKTDFTLFDLTDDNPAIKKFRAYGQFLIIVRNQN